MTDLILGAALITLLSVGFGVASARIAARLSSKAMNLYLVALIVATIAFCVVLRGRLPMARLLPWSNVIVVGEWVPIGIGGLIGGVLVKGGIPRWRRLLLAFGLATLGIYALTQPFLDSPPRSMDRWSKEGVCLQSSAASCSACAAATLLRSAGIESSETEMIPLCLTGTTGTPTLGMYRGLKLKTRHTPWSVSVFSANVDQLFEQDCWPVLLPVVLPRGAKVDPRYQQEWGWTPGLGHVVVVYGRVGNDRIDVGDPSIGREHWTVEDLRVLWPGYGMRLVRR
jgi:hypothetical protein